jgi:OFA family oxalate/formate antiporter-like MFS transporter
MLYTAKGTAALVVPLASLISSHMGWQAVFVVAVALNATAALMALFVIRPMRRAFILGNGVTATAAPIRAKTADGDTTLVNSSIS